MTRPLASLSPQQAAKEQAAARAYYQRNRDRYKDYRGRPEIVARRQAYYAANRDRYRTHNVRSDIKRTAARRESYGWTQERIDEMLSAQEGCCAICGNVMQTAVPDHNHATNTPRSLLCRSCNLMLGFLENVEWRTLADSYLAQWAT